MRACLPIVALALWVPDVAEAQPDASPPALSPSVPEKSETLAAGLALGSVALGAVTLYSVFDYEGGTRGVVTLVSAGLSLLYLGPSAGHLYAGEYRHAAFMTGVRGTGFIAAVVGLTRLACEGESDITCPDSNVALALLAGGAIAYLGGTFYDLYDSRRAVRRHNARRGSVVIAPSLLPSGHGAALAIGVSGSF